MNPPRSSIQPLQQLPGVESELMRLVSSLCDGSPTQSDCRRLEALLEDPQAMAAYIALTEQHAALLWQTRSHAPVVLAEVPGRIAPPRSSVFGGFRQSLAIAAGALALLLLAAASVLLPPNSGGPQVDQTPAGPSVARITAVSDARWDRRVLRVGDAVGSGPLRLLDGCAQLKFASGATVVLNGATDLEVVNDKRIFLRSGKITPFVPPEAHGFTVVSPSGEVVDLGTEFSVGVDAKGLTSVYVIDGEVDVATGHSRRQTPLRMTQGFGAQLSAPSAAGPDVTQQPIVIDHFDIERTNANPNAVGDMALRWIDLDSGHPAIVEGGSLRIPIDDDPAWADPAVRILLDHDFSSLVGRRSVISFKATLPEIGTAGFRRWVALIIDSSCQPIDPPQLPLAHREEAAVGVMVSPEWQAGLRTLGERHYVKRLFRRNEDAVGPYQIVVSIDDSPEVHEEYGSATLGLMINGVDAIRNKPIELGQHPRLGFHTFVPRAKGGHGKAVAFIDDFSVSVSVEAAAAEASP